MPQEPTDPRPAIPADSAAADEAAAGGPAVGPLPGELTGTLQDSAAADRPFPHLIPELQVPSEGHAAPMYEWDRETILASNALTLLDLLTEVVPGLTAVRATWFGGPHHVLAGAFGPGFVSVSVDGRELTPLEAGQVDLTRIALAYVDGVRVRRRADGWTAELTTVHRSSAPAYSRITGGTGDPGLSRLRLVYTNSAGRHFNVAASADLLNTASETPEDDFDFWGNIEWIPGEGNAGVELHFDAESLNRTVFGPADINRTELFLRGRGNLMPGLQAQGFVGSTELKLDDEKVRDTNNAGFRLTGSGEWGWFRAGMDVWDDDIFPQVDVNGEAGFQLTPWLALEAGGRMTGWDGFTTAEARGGIALTRLPLQGSFTVQGASGRRGVTYPARGTTDSLSFDAAAGTLGMPIGPFRISERVEYQSVNRQLPFGAIFDLEQPAGDGLELLAFETGVSGPILPLGMILGGVAPLRIRGFWRYTSILSDGTPAYLPESIVRGELFFHDEFLDGNLELRMAVRLDRRDAMFSAANPAGPPAGGEPLIAVPAYTFFDWDLMVRVLDVRIYWRFENMTGQAAQDQPGLVFPSRRSVFGVKWEFLN